ncbi:MAG: WG repeat-containing protein, partial [Campylobacteraceae bacterium]
VYDFEKNVIIPEIYDDIYPILKDRFVKDGYVYLVKKSDKKGFVDKNGTVLVDLKYKEQLALNKDEIIFSVDKNCGVMDINETILLEPRYEFLSFTGIKGLYITTKDNLFGVIGVDGKFLLEPKYDFITGFIDNGNILVYKDSEQIIFEYKDDKLKAISKLDYAKSLAALYDKPFPHKNKDGFYGFVNKKGDWAIKPIYSMAGEFSDSGYAIVVSKDNLVKIINTKGNMILSNELVCDFEVIKDKNGKIIYPLKSKKEICKK